MNFNKNDIAQRTNGVTPWESSTSMNYNGSYYNTSQQTQTYTVTTFTVGNRTYNGTNVPVFTNVVRSNNNGKN